MSTTTTTKDILTLHRAVIVLSLRRDDANMASVHAMEAAKSMLPDDLAASLAADRAYVRAAAEHDAVEREYRAALREEAT